ncbi:hypothetical protein [Fredinandcohnia quinoae]|uniref:Uncharacterized protein n=1 Tax=Fredinandcohnia quinoae TaxID=2918902 RepID=A0AAW5E264_9BACI|nr:hypothetical protein [Fredinandcohnia sp. SECRCQ15]MCH1626708.1 hypothetical protein [Fredinandcohnia sp. SECRCQ15]
MSKKRLMQIAFVVFFVILITINYNPTLEKAISQNIGPGNVIDVFNSQNNGVVVYKFLSNDGSESLNIGAYEKNIGSYEYISNNELSIGLSTTNLRGFLTNYFFTHPKTDNKYLYGIINTPQNVKEVRASYDIQSESIAAMSMVVKQMFLIPVVNNVEQAENWLFSFYDENGNLLKETSEFAY